MKVQEAGPLCSYTWLSPPTSNTGLKVIFQSFVLYQNLYDSGRNKACYFLGGLLRPLQIHQTIQTWDIPGRVVDGLGKLFPPQGSLFFYGCHEDRTSCSHLSPSLRMKPAPERGQNLEKPTEAIVPAPAQPLDFPIIEANVSSFIFKPV